MIRVGVAAHRAGTQLPGLVVLTLALAVLSVSARAGEPLYVIEQLVIGVNSAPDGTGDRVAIIKSGDRVEVLDRRGDEAQVRLTNGTSGWVKASYLSREVPLQRRLQEQTTEVERLRQQVALLQSQSHRDDRPAALAAQAAARGTVVAGAADQTAVPSGTVRDPSSFMGRAESAAPPAWVWVIACSLAALVVGFVAGWRMLDRRIRRKYGGLRIY